MEKLKISNSKIGFNIKLEYKISVICGDSGKGKTTLFELCSEYLRYNNTGIKNNSSLKLAILPSGLDLDIAKLYLSKYENCIFIFDEDDNMIYNNEFIGEINNSKNYFIIITRKNISGLHNIAYYKLCYDEKSKCNVNIKLTTNGESKMLHVFIGTRQDSTGMGIPESFKYAFSNNWINTEFAKRAIAEIDKSKVIGDRVIESPYLGTISPLELSGGIKSLLMMAYEEKLNNIYFDGELFGDNVLPFILELSKSKEVYMTDEHLLIWPDNLNNVKIHIVNDDSYITTYKEYLNKYGKYKDTEA